MTIISRNGYNLSGKRHWYQQVMDPYWYKRGVCLAIIFGGHISKFSLTIRPTSLVFLHWYPHNPDVNKIWYGLNCWYLVRTNCTKVLHLSCLETKYCLLATSTFKVVFRPIARSDVGPEREWESTGTTPDIKIHPRYIYPSGLSAAQSGALTYPDDAYYHEDWIIAAETQQPSALVRESQQTPWNDSERLFAFNWGWILVSLCQIFRNLWTQVLSHNTLGNRDRVQL